MDKFDFSGWATKANLKCSDGRIIRQDAFKDNDGQKVPLVWNHKHDDTTQVLGHALLENRDGGVYAYCKFNNTESGKTAKELVKHGDVDKLSIYANQLKQQGPNVIHGNIREVSLVLAGANPGALIEDVMMHSSDGDYILEDECIIHTGDYFEVIDENAIEHSSEDEKKDELEHAEDKTVDENKDKKDGEETVADVIDSMNEKQQTVMYALIAEAMEGNFDDNEDEDEKGGNEDMKHNVFEKEENKNTNVLSHADEATIIDMAKAPSVGSLQHAMAMYAEENSLQHGIDDIEKLFPDYQLTNPGAPELLERDQTWVGVVMNKAHKSPISRIRTRQADARAAEIRAKGYKKGAQKTLSANLKLLSRTTDPQTIYRKDELHRDDIIDITDFDVVAYIKAEMRMMLDEEIARAILVGDGRSTSSDDKIPETNIRPIAKDEDLYTIKAPVAVAKDATEDAIAKAFIRTVIKTRKEYKGSGSPTLFTTEDMLTNCLLLEDNNGRIIYDSVDKLATTLRVKEIVPVEVMEGVTRTAGAKNLPLMAILVNLNDYYVGADKGGAINMFDDFDIDYNQEKYLIETRISGALVKPYSAIAFELDKAQA